MFGIGSAGLSVKVFRLAMRAISGIIRVDLSSWLPLIPAAKTAALVADLPALRTPVRQRIPRLSEYAALGTPHQTISLYLPCHVYQVYITTINNILSGEKNRKRFK